MDILFVAITFGILGLIIGSFLNVVVLRLEKDMTLGGRSMCPACKELIHWYDNIPVLSFFLLRGKCRRCEAAISWQYPAVELTTAVLFALFGTLAFGDGQWPEIVRVIWYLFLVALFVAIAVYDIRNMEIPLVLLLVGVGAAAAYAVIGTIISGVGILASEAIWRDMLWGGGITALLFYGLVFYSKETWMGMGDVWLAGIAGAVVGIASLLFLLTLSFFAGAVVGGVLLLRGRKAMKSQIPFAPFLVFGTLATLFFEITNPWWLPFFLLPLV